MIYQKDIIDASKLRQIASRDVCYRVIRKLVAEGKIIRHKDKSKQNSVYFAEKDARIVTEALSSEAERRLSLLEPAAVDLEPQPAEPADPEATSAQPAEEPQPQPTKAATEPKSIKQLAVAPGPQKRAPSKTKQKTQDASDPDHPKDQGKLGLPKDIWLYVGAGALLLLAFGWWRAHRRSPVTDTAYDYAAASEPTDTETPRTTSDEDQLAHWNDIFKGI